MTGREIEELKRSNKKWIETKKKEREKGKGRQMSCQNACQSRSGV